MERICFVLGLVLYISLTGCATHNVRVSTWPNDRDVILKNDGIPFFLPKTALQLNVTYTVKEEIPITYGVMQRPLTSISIKKPIVITPFTVADKRNKFLISWDNISDSTFLESGLAYELSDSGILLGTEAEIKDKTPETITEIVAAGLKIAAISAVAGEDELPRKLAAIYRRMDDLYAALANSAGKLDELEKIKKELFLYEEIIKDYRNNNKKEVSETDIQYSVLIHPEDPAECKWKDSDTSYHCIIENKINGITAPNVELALRLSKAEYARSEKVFTGPPDNAKIDGIIYRLAEPVLTTALVNGVRVSSSYISFPQFGTYSVVGLQSKKFGNRKTSILFSNSSGNLKKYAVTSGSSGDKITKELNANLDSIKSAITDLQYNTKIQDLKKQTDLLEARNKAIEAGRALDNAKSDGH